MMQLSHNQPNKPPRCATLSVLAQTILNIFTTQMNAEITTWSRGIKKVTNLQLESYLLTQLHMNKKLDVRNPWLKNIILVNLDIQW